MKNNFVVEEYLINVTQNSSKSKRYYIIKKYSTNNEEITLIENNTRLKIELQEIQIAQEREIVEKYLRKVSTAKLKYGTSYLNSLLKDKFTLNIVEFGNAKEVEYFIKEDKTYKIVRYYYDVKGNMFYKIMGEKWCKKNRIRILFYSVC